MKEISIAVCFDENYALNGAMVLHSAAQNIKKGIKIKAYVIDGGVKEKTKKRFKKIAKDNLEIIWLKPDLSIFNDLPLSPWTTKVSHARLLIPNIIPKRIKKILYLDSDMLVLDDITELWKLSLGNHVLFALQDLTYSHVHKKTNSQALIAAGMASSSPYFNSGLLFINLFNWGKNDVLSKYIEILYKMGHKFTHCNQDALNIILNDKWKPLNHYWLAANTIYQSSKEGIKKIVKNKKMIHFTGTTPGLVGCKHPLKDIFYKYVFHSSWFSKREYFLWRSNLFIKDIHYSALRKVKLFLKSKIKGTRIEPFSKGIGQFIKKILFDSDI